MEKQHKYKGISRYGKQKHQIRWPANIQSLILAAYIQMCPVQAGNQNLILLWVKILIIRFAGRSKKTEHDH